MAVMTDASSNLYSTWLHIKTFEPTATHRLGQAGYFDDRHHKKWFAEGTFQKGSTLA